MNDGKLSWNSNPDELQEGLSGRICATSDISVPIECRSQQQKELGIPEPSTPLFGASSSSNPFARMNSPFAFGTHSVQPTQSVHHISSLQFNQVSASNHLIVQSPELVNRPSIQIPTSSAVLFNPVTREPHQLVERRNSSRTWINDVPPRFPDVGHIAEMSIGPTQGNNITINQISRFIASSSQVPTYGTEYQNQMTGLTGTTAPVVGFSEQVAMTPFNSGSIASSTMVPIGNFTLGSSSSIRPTLSSLEIGNPAMPTQMSNGGSAFVNIHEGGVVDQQSVGDQMNNTNELPKGTSEKQNGAVDDIFGDFFADWIFSEEEP